MLVLTIDNLATKYHCLPSEILDKADTFDLYTMDISTKFRKHQQDAADGKATGAPRPSEAEMLKMLQRVKNKK
jgi:hypothetical protein